MSRSTEHFYVVSGEEEYDRADKGDDASEKDEETTDGDQPIRSLRTGRHPSSSPT